MTTPSLLVELFVEELPPKALQKLGQAFSDVLSEQLRAQGLLSANSVVTSYATPRRLAAHISAVIAQAPDRQVEQKLMPVAVGLDASGNATPALLKKLQALGAGADAVAQLRKAPEPGNDALVLFYDSQVKGATLALGLQKALDEAIAKLPIPKVMTYQLEKNCELPGWSSVQFVRPAHGLVAMHGSSVVPVTALGLQAGNSTQGHRFEARVSPVIVKSADTYAEQLKSEGAVIASFAERRDDITRQLAAVAAKIGGGIRAIEDSALLDEVTALVERPNVLGCTFEKEFLDVPPECLILTMKANQKYFPLLNSQGKLSNQFLVVSNITPVDASAVIGGNERVVRPRLADAKFFFDQDRKKSLAIRAEGLANVVYHNKLGTQAERTQRVRAIAKAIAGLMYKGDDATFLHAVDTAAQLAKADLLTNMVGEFPELQGIMGGYFARHDGLYADIAEAIEDHYKPRFAGDDLPRNPVGLVVAMADKLETLVGMFGIGNLPTGDKDPFALRRHALGVIRMLRESSLSLSLSDIIGQTVAVFGSAITDTHVQLLAFFYDRLSASLREQGFSAQEVESVLALRPQELSDITRRLQAVRAFAALPESQALAAANKRIGNILKKADDVQGDVNESLLTEAAEKALFQTMQRLTPEAHKQWVAGDYTASLQTLSALRTPVDAFFDDVMVNAEDLALRHNRQRLLKQLRVAMNQVADLACLAV